MPSLSRDAPPPPFACQTCEHPDWSAKAGPGCQRCPALRETHYYPHGAGAEDCDVLVVGDVPEPPRLALVPWAARAPYHQAFEDDAGRVVRGAVRDVGARADFRAVGVRYVYGVKCAVGAPAKAVVAACQGPLAEELRRVHAARTRGRAPRSLVVLACGVSALHSLGVAVRSEADAQGRVYETTVAGVPLVVVVTRSLKAIAAATGKYSSLLADVERAFRAATGTTIAVAPRADLEPGYVYPRTNLEVEALCEMVATYAEGDTPASAWAISCDTETNTLFPHRKDLICTVFSLAWSPGKAASIPLWHPQLASSGFVADGYDPARAFAAVGRLLATRKPTIWHNYKYDVKVLWRLGLPRDACHYAWDVMSAEHVLEEDKKRQYSLKYLTKQYLPRYAGYEDKVRDVLEQHDAEKLRDEEAARAAAPRVVKAPEAVLAALARLQQTRYPRGTGKATEPLLKGERFVPAALEKKVAAWAARDPGVDPQVLLDARVVCAAKRSGEFRAVAEKVEKKIATGGYEEIPLPDLAFYAAVDADVTRQLAVQQVRRMGAEDHALEQVRRRVEVEQRYGRNAAFPVQRLCPDPAPLKALTKDHYLPRAVELADVEFHGVKIDRRYLRDGAVDLARTVQTTEEQVYELTGTRLNLNSSRQLAAYLFTTGHGYLHPDPAHAEQVARDNPEDVTWDGRRLAYRPRHYTERGALQTGAPVLQYLVARYQCPLANLLLSRSKAEKAHGSFFVNIDKLAEFGEGWIRPGYNLNGTGTGRLSSSSGVMDIGFNNQNIPKGHIGALKDTRGKLILEADGTTPVFEGVNCKKLFLPDDDTFAYFNADAKGAEVGIFTAYARDAALIAALTDGMDAHSFFGSKCLDPRVVGAGLTGEARRVALKSAGIDDEHGWTYEDFLAGKDGLHPDTEYGKRLKKLRDNIKRLVFGLLYGAGYKKIADIAGISHDQAKKIQDLLFKMFPSIRTYMDRVKWELRAFNMAETYFGRRRRFLLQDAPSKLVAQAERRLLNFSIQSTNSDVVLMVLCWVAPQVRAMGGRLLGTVHDSIMFQVPKRYAHQVKELFAQVTRHVAATCPWLPVPFRWDVEAGPSYGETMPVDRYLQSLPPPLPEPELDGYTAEDIRDKLREATDEPPQRMSA